MSAVHAANPSDYAPRRGRLHPVSLAPMMQYTDRHFRYLLRLISRHALLYTEMVTAQALLHGDCDRHLAYHEAEHPVALQLGGDDPAALAHCARLAARWGYDEVNLNVGCPSDRVQNGSFGACLMATPHRVAECVAAMREATALPVTVKHRIGIDELDQYDHMAHFVEVVAQAGCDRFIVHARKAWLQGLSPKQNRTVPPLQYEHVWRLKRERPGLAIEVNGGIRTLEDIKSHLVHTDGVMIGRAVYDDPFLFSRVDAEFYGCADPAVERGAVAEAMIPYAEQAVRDGSRLHSVTRHMLNLFAGQPRARVWKRALAEGARESDDASQVIGGALRTWREAARDHEIRGM